MIVNRGKILFIFFVTDQSGKMGELVVVYLCGSVMDVKKNRSTVTFRLSDSISSTQAELYGIYVDFYQVKDTGKVVIFVDRRAKLLDSLNSSPMYAIVVSV